MIDNMNNNNINNIKYNNMNMNNNNMMNNNMNNNYMMNNNMNNNYMMNNNVNNNYMMNNNMNNNYMNNNMNNMYNNNFNTNNMNKYNMNINNINNNNKDNMINNNINNMNMNINMYNNNINNKNLDDVNDINLNMDNISYSAGMMNDKNTNNNTKNINANRNNILLKSEKDDEEISNFLINIKYFNLKNNISYPIKNLCGLLNLCLIKYISNYFNSEEIKKVLSPQIKRIILKLQKNIKFGEDNKENIKMILNESKGNNILIYSQYINEIFNDNIKIKNLINLLEEEKRKEIDIYWGCLSNYNEYNIFFEKEFEKDLKKTKFDYSLISLAILEKEEEDEEEYKSKRDACPNIIKRILYHGSQIDPISKILTDEFKYSRKAFYGMGIYFSDIIDYIAFYCGGTGINNRRKNFGNIVPVHSAFSFIASEVFYDKNKFRQIKDMSLYVPELDHFPSYEELKQKYHEKMIEPNGIHFIRVNDEGDALTEKDFFDKKNKGQFLGNEYAITEKYQIFPIYSLTVKRNEYFVLWRDPNFKGENKFTNYLKERKLFCMEKANMNIYFESSTEEALKFLLRRQYNKVILITSIGLDLSGKKFIEIARKIFGFDLMVLFFSANEAHLKWIQKFQNCLYKDQANFYEEYITNFNKDGLLRLKRDVEKEYNITLLNFSENILSYPNFKNDGDFSSFNFSNNNKYIRHVKICCKNKDLFFNMKENGNVELSEEPSMWDVTIIDNEITFFSNGYYLDVSKIKNEDKEVFGEELVGYRYMIIWNFEMDSNYYIFYYPKKEKDNKLSSENNILKVNKIEIGESEYFILLDELEE